jgi:hypothetical protein
MPIAAPLLIPFAEAIGIAIGGLGIMEISDKVQKFIQNNRSTKSIKSSVCKRNQDQRLEL